MRARKPEAPPSVMRADNTYNNLPRQVLGQHGIRSAKEERDLEYQGRRKLSGDSSTFLW